MIKAFVENGRLISLLIALLTVAGLGAVSSLPRTEDPHITNRFASVITPYSGASAERVEVLVTQILEDKLRRIEEIKLFQSTSRAGMSVIQLELKDSVTDTTPIWSRARDLINEASTSLPTGASPPLLDDQIGYAYTAIINVSWQSHTPIQIDILNRYAKALQSQLRLLSGTDFVKLYGAPTEEIQVKLDSQLLRQLQLTPAAVAHILSQADAKVAAGEITNNRFNALIEISGELDSQARIANVPIKSDVNGHIIRLGDIASISRQPKTPAESMALSQGKQSIFVAVRMLDNMRVDVWQTQVEQIVEEFNQTLPTNVKVNWLFEQNSYTADRLHSLVGNLLQGFGIILLVLLLTLGLRNAVIVALSLPLTALFTLACMRYIGLPIHQMSVTGLVVALGIMVDNAIVIVDAIAQRRQQGLSRLHAVKETLHHLWLPLAGSTLTTMLAFSPIVLMPGAAGEFVGGIAISVMFALIGSYLISHTIIAGLAGRFSHSGTPQRWYQHGLRFPRLSHLFKASLTTILKRPAIGAVVIGLIPIFGFYAATHMIEQFFPPSDRDMFQIEVYLAPQTSLASTLEQVQQIDAQLQPIDGVQLVNWVIGGNTPSFYYNLTQRQQGASHYAQAMVKVTNFQRANQLIPQLQQQLDRQFPQAQILVRTLEQGPPFNAPVELRIVGPNLDTLRQLGDSIRLILAATPDVLHSRATLDAGTPKVWIQVNEDASLMSQLTLTDIASQIQMATAGVIGGSIIEQTESIPIRLRLGDEQRKQENRLAEIQLVSPKGDVILLGAIASNDIHVSRGAIPRRNSERVNTIEAYITSGVLPATVLNHIQAQLAQLPLPSGYRIEVGGESAERNKAVGNLLSNVLLVVTLLLATVVLSFNSFRLTAIILLSGIQSAGLGLLAVFVFGYPFGFPVIIGLLGLTGLAINAAIVILAELEAQPNARGCDINMITHTVNQCGRHIGSTTITTIGGFMPLIIAGGGFWPPFAIAIAGGTLLTTMLSLAWVPTMYRLLMQHKSPRITQTT